MNMRRIGIALTVLSLLVLGGCGMVLQPAGEDGFYRLGVQTASQGRAVAASALPPIVAAQYNNIAKAVVTITNLSGVVVTNSDVLQLFNLNGSYLSESVKINRGTYRVTRYLVADSSNNVIFATPLQGSPLAGQVSQPLPVTFSVFSNSVVNVVPEILPVAGHTAAEFGYEGTSFPDPNALSYPSSTLVKNYNLGADGAAFSDDDVCYGYTLQDYASYHLNKDAKLFETVDGVIQNGDDIINGWWNTEPTLDKGSWKTGGPGDDHAWFTPDDVIVRTENWSGTAQNGILYQPICTDPGPDQVWFTTDDVQTAYYKDTLDANNNLLRREFHSGTGPNGPLAEDWFGAYYVNTYEGLYNRYWSWTRQDRFNIDGTLKEYVIHEFGDARFPRFFTKEIYFNPQGQVTRYAVAVNYE